MSNNGSRNSDDGKPCSWLTTKDVARILGIHRNTVRRWSNMGLLRASRVSRRGDRRYRFEDITSFLDDMNEPD